VFLAAGLGRRLGSLRGRKVSEFRARQVLVAIADSARGDAVLSGQRAGSG